ncbi:hypothetical protein DFJ74DRAFT_489667 [Hyaloraphidium curvatum]|nr:hypothetical protein DFJ74DRAFT_489667 [Hyaloraphidium curvatum]
MVTVILTGIDKFGNFVNRSTTTGPDGRYQFEGLWPGNYTIDSVNPAGLSDTPQGQIGKLLVSLGDGQRILDQNFGKVASSPSTTPTASRSRSRTPTSTAVPPGSISGRVYLDADLDGKDGGEPAVAGVDVVLVGTDHLGRPVQMTATAGADGSYRFDGVPPGTYGVSCAAPAGHAFSPAGPQGQVQGILLVPGGSEAADFGMLRVASTTWTIATATRSRTSSTFTVRAELGGRIFVDANTDGVDNGEPAIPGVTIFVTGTDDQGNPVNVSTTTAQDGTYIFENLRPGTYTVTPVVPAGFVSSPGGPTEVTLSLVDGDNKQDVDLGFVAMTSTSSSLTTATRSRTSSTFTVRAELGGRIFVDANTDGVDNGEPAIPGVTIFVTGTDDQGNPVNVSTTTAQDGTFVFENLRPGTYTVTPVVPAGFVSSPGGPTEVTLSLVDGDNKQDVDLGFVAMTSTSSSLTTATRSRTSSTFTVRAELGGRIFVDANTDGVDNGEPAIPGVTIFVTGTDDQGNPVNVSTTTAQDGTYIFENLRPGTYIVTPVVPAGFVSSPGGPTEVTLSLVDGDNKQDVDLGFVAMTSTSSSLTTATRSRTSSTFTVRAELGGRIFVDANTDGVDNGEPAIPGVTIFVTGTDDQGNPVNVSTTTAQDGTYIFENLRPGTYIVTPVVPAGFVSSPGGPTEVTLSLVDGDNKQDVDLGFVAMTSTSSSLTTATRSRTSSTFTVRAELGGRIFVDANTDGVDNGEPAIPGVTIFVTGTDDQGNPVNVSTTTAQDGTYIFENLRPGTYIVTPVVPAGFVSSPGGPTEVMLSLVDADNKQDVDLGFVAMTSTSSSLTTATRSRTSSTFTVRAELGGRIFVDANTDGVDNGEPAIPRVTIFVTGTDDQGNAVNVSTTTAQDGTFVFENLRPGTYTVTPVVPAGFVSSPGGPTEVTLSLVDGDSKQDVDLGFVAMTSTSSSLTTATRSRTSSTFTVRAELGGRIFVDANTDGVDNGEPAIPGVTIFVTGTDDQGNPVNVSTTTAQDGTFVFENLRPGTYTVTPVVPAGFVSSPGGPTEVTLSLVDGDSKQDVDLGFVAMTSTSSSLTTATRSRTSSTFTVRAELGGRIFVDANTDGVDNGEPAIPGVTIFVTGTDDQGNPVNVSTTTAQDGTFVFENLRPGTYTVTPVVPAGFVSSPGGPTEVTLSLVDGDSKQDVDLGFVAMTSTSSSLTTATRSPTSSTFTVRAELGGRIFVDANTDGVDNGEPAIPRVTIFVTGTDDQGNAVNVSTTTAQDGTFVFENLRPGTYTVTPVVPAGFVSSPGGPTEVTLSLVDGDNKQDVDLGFVAMTSTSSSLTTATRSRTSSTFTVRAELGGRIFVDANTNGVDNGEPAIPGVTIFVTGTDDQGNPVNVSTTTAQDGTYIFENLRPGTYTVAAVTPDGYVSSPGGPIDIPNVSLADGDVMLDKDLGFVLETSTTWTVTVSESETPTTSLTATSSTSLTISLTTETLTTETSSTTSESLTATPTSTSETQSRTATTSESQSLTATTSESASATATTSESQTPTATTSESQSLTATTSESASETATTSESRSLTATTSESETPTTSLTATSSTSLTISLTTETLVGCFAEAGIN